ncbi:hypothetical protein Tco_0272526 [Tanacetum coccineum]
MSSPNRSTSDIEDAFSSMNILNYTSVSSDYFPASLGSNSFNSSENSNDNMIPPNYYHLRSKYVPHLLPQLHKMYLKHHEKQVEDILNYLDELHLHRIERMEEERTNDNVVEEEDEEHIRFLGGNSSSGTKKYRGSNSSDGGNTEMESK